MGKKKISNKNKKQENFERDNFLRRGLFDGKEQIKKWPLAALFLTAEHWLILRCPIQKTLVINEYFRHNWICTFSPNESENSTTTRIYE